MSRNISFNFSITGILPSYAKAQQYHNYSFFSGVPYFKSKYILLLQLFG